MSTFFTTFLYISCYGDYNHVIGYLPSPSWFCSWKFVLLATCLQFPLVPPLPLVPMGLTSSDEFGFFCLWDSTYKWGHTVFVFLWLISPSIMPSRPIQEKKNTYIITSSVWKENRNTMFRFTYIWASAQNSYQSVDLGRKKLKEGDWKYVEVCALCNLSTFLLYSEHFKWK